MPIARNNPPVDRQKIRGQAVAEYLVLFTAFVLLFLIFRQMMLGGFSGHVMGTSLRTGHYYHPEKTTGQTIQYEISQIYTTMSGVPTAGGGAVTTTHDAGYRMSGGSGNTKTKY